MRRLRLLLASTLLVPLGTMATADVATSPEEITSSTNLTRVAGVAYRGGTDLELTKINGRRYVVAGTQNNYNPTLSPGIRLVDVTDPKRPRTTGFLPCNTSQNDVQVRGGYAYLAVDFNQKSDPEGRRDCWSQLGDLSPAPGVVVVDIRNPKAPRAVGFLALKPGDGVNYSEGAHNTTLHPTKPLLYISDSDLATNTRLMIADVSRPTRPKLVKVVELTPGDGIHDISFNRKGTRAYIAGSFTQTAIVDTTNPLAPSVIARIADPAINFHHQAEVTPDGKHLIISDELAGAEGLAFCPGGGLHVYDVSNESVPRKVGAFYIPDAFVETKDTNNGPRTVVGPLKPFRCTAHVFRIAPDGRSMTMAWYSQGIQVLDLTGLASGVSAGAGGTSAPLGIQRIGFWKVRHGDAWSAKMDDRGYIFTGDTQRGMDVVRYTKPKAGERVEPGIWLTPEESLARGLADKATAGANTYFCFDRTYREGLA